MQQPNSRRGGKDFRKSRSRNSGSNGKKVQTPEPEISDGKKNTVIRGADNEALIRFPPVVPSPSPPGPMPPPISGSQTFDPKALLAAFRRRWLLATTLGLIVGMIAAGTTYQFYPEAGYTAFSELHINAVQERILFRTSEAVTQFNTYKQTQMRLVTSPFVLSAALRNPEVANLSSVQAQAYPVQWLEKQIKVSSPGTEFIRISMSGEIPSELHRLVNAVSTAYMEEVVNSDLTKRNERKSNLDRILRDLEDRMQKKKTAERRLAESLNTGDSQALTLKQQMAVEYFAQLRKEHAQVRFDLMRSRIQLEARRATAADDVPVEIPEAVIEARISRDPEIQQLSADMAMAQELESRTRERVNRDDHPLLVQTAEKLKRLQSSLGLAREKIRPAVIDELNRTLHSQSEATEKGLEREIELLSAEEQQLASELESQKLEARQIGISSFELESLKKEVAQMDKVATSISDEIQKLTIELQTPPRITLHRSAEIPSKRDASSKPKLTAMAGFGGFGAVVAGLLWLEVLARRISSTHDVADGLGLPILGSLPQMPGWMRNGTPANTTSQKHKARRAVIRSVWTESVDAARTVLLRSSALDSKNIVMIASAMGGEGKTTLSCHLAISLARGGRRTLLIDTDMRRPSVHKVFGLQFGPGFSELLRGEVQVDEVIQSANQDGLSVISAGKVNQATLRALAQNSAGTIFDELRAKFDFIVIDSPPVLPVNDSLLIGQNVDSVVFSIRRDVSRFGKVLAACQRLSMLGIPVIGSVVTGLDQTTYGYRYGYGYGYGAYGYNVPTAEMVRRSS